MHYCWTRSLLRLPRFQYYDPSQAHKWVIMTNCRYSRWALEPALWLMTGFLGLVENVIIKGLPNSPEIRPYVCRRVFIIPPRNPSSRVEAIIRHKWATKPLTNYIVTFPNSQKSQSQCCHFFTKEGSLFIHITNI